MLYIRKYLTRAERKEYKHWLEKHRSEIRPVTRTQQTQEDREYWNKQARAIELQRSLRSESYKTIPSIVDQNKIVQAEIATKMTPEEYERREAAAQLEIEAKQLRIAPVYNKGAAMYWTEDMAIDLKTGGHRRR
jgi:hypothetical protein